MKKETEMPKKTDSNEKTPELESVKVPEYKLVDVMRELKSLSNDFNAMSEAVKALGADIIKNNEEASAVFMDFQNQIGQLQRAFIAVTDQVLAMPQTATKRVDQQAQTGNPQFEQGISEAELDALRWTNSKGHYGGQWAFRYERDTQNPFAGTEKLQSLIVNGGGKTKLYGRTYKFSGANGMFISRSDKK